MDDENEPDGNAKEEPPLLLQYEPKFRVETRLFIVARDGSGTALSIKVDKRRKTLKCGRCHRDEWSSTKGFVDFAVAGLRNKIYMIGGYDKSKRTYSRRVLRYDPEDDSMDEVASLTTGRRGHNAIGYKGGILVTGGEVKKGRNLSRAEFYEPDKNQWEEFPSLLQPRSNHQSAILDGCVYITGGTISGNTKSNVWVYENQKCKQLDPDYPVRLQNPAQNQCMAAISPYLYILGGVHYDVKRDGRKVLRGINNTIHSFKPRLGAKDFNTGSSEIREIVEDHIHNGGLSVAVDNKEDEEGKIDISMSDMISPWDYSLTKMVTPVYGAGCITIGSVIFVIGGVSKENDGLLHFQCFDIITKLWTDMGALPYETVGVLEKTGNVGCTTATYKRMVSMETESPDSDEGAEFPNKWILW